MNYVLTVCVDGIPEGRDFDVEEEAIDAAEEAILRHEEDPTKSVSLVLSDSQRDYRAGPPRVLTAEDAMSILFGYHFDELDFDARTARFASGADVCASLAHCFNLGDEEINRLAKLRRER